MRLICFIISVGVLTAQGPGAASPASKAPPKTLTKQVYTAEQIHAGEQRFIAQCGFCHGRDAAGGETGPDLTRSTLVAEDNRGDRIKPLLREGRAAEGMPAFSLSDTDMNAIVAWIHDEKNKSETLGGGRRSVDPSDLAVGNAEAGRTYFNGAGKCSTCHSPTGDLEGIATRYKGLALLQRMLYPTGKPTPVNLSAHFDQLGKYTDEDMHNVYAYLDTLK
jgi:cytochrome c oxidase cbb3-type subunit III